VRRIAVLADAGWEARFVVAALEERGWPVDARLRVAPELDVVQGRPLPLDTTRHAAVIVLDSLPERDARAVAGFVRSGGGAVLGSGAVAGPLAGLAPGGVGAWVRPPTLIFADNAPRRALGFAPVTPLRPGAVALETRGRAVAVAARRVGSGRVVQVGYGETWRWRLAGGANAPDAHRAWWAGIVASAAYRPVVAPDEPAPHTALAATAGPAPYALLVSALGPPVVATTIAEPRERPRWLVPALGLFLFASLLAEWASRRRRGVP
jgi:hypothetical protein